MIPSLVELALIWASFTSLPSGQTSSPTKVGLGIVAICLESTACIQCQLLQVDFLMYDPLKPVSNKIVRRVVTATPLE